MKLKPLLAILLMGLAAFVHAQDISPKKGRHSIGFISGYGGQIALNEAYHYEVVFLQGQYYYALLRKKKWSIALLAQPQYNLTKYQPIDSEPTVAHGYELGMNMGVVVKKNLLREHLSIYLLLSIGPHYVSGVPDRQVSGFIFSDNILMGLHVKITDQLYLDIRSGFRHISNANLEHPNGGVDTTILSGGFFFILP